MSQYKAYPAYKDSGVEWIGQVPEEWKTGKLKHLGTLKGGSGFPIDMQGRPDNELPFYKVGDLSKSQDNISLIGSSNTISRSEAKDLGATVFPDNTIAWAKIGAALLLNRRRVSRTACCLDNNMTGFIVDSKKVPVKYAFYLMNAIDFSFFARPGAVPSLSEGEQSSIPIAIPSYEESLTIAATLDQETARIDALIEKKTRFIELLKEKRQALITHAVTKGLDRNAKMKDSGIEWIGQVPEHWKVARVKRLASLRNERRNDVSTDTIYIGLEDVEAGSGQYKPTNGSSRQSEDSTVGIFYEGDVLYGKLRPYLRKAIISEMAGCCSTEFLVLRAEKTEPRWLQEWLLTPDVTHQIVSGCEGAKMPRADWGHIGSIEVVYPDQPEQAKILTSLDRETARIDALISKAEQSITLLKERRAAFITAAVTGQIDLRGKQ